MTAPSPMLQESQLRPVVTSTREAQVPFEFRIVHAPDRLLEILELRRIAHQTAHKVGPHTSAAEMIEPRDLEASFEYASHQYPDAEPHRLILVGGGGEVPGLDGYLNTLIGPEVVSADTPGVQHAGAMMAAAAYEPPAGRLDIIKKDAGLIADHASAVGVSTPALDLALGLFTDASHAGLGSLDAAAIKRYLEELDRG